MIITKKGEQLRNLEEQVQYLTNYHNVNQGLVQWGIRVIGQVETASELPDPATYKGEFGDAYAVGTEAPFFFYIWTRASVVGESDYWFPFGKISIVGPSGPTPLLSNNGEYITSTDPETGKAQNVIALSELRGESTRWYAGAALPADVVSNPTPGTMYLQTANGDVYEFDSNEWKYKGNIRGSDGIQGISGPAPQIYVQDDYIVSQDPKTGNVTRVVSLQQITGGPGPTGDPGAFINIRGIIDNVGQLPTPASLNNLSAAYLVGGNKELYVQVGEEPATATWNNIGPLNAATLVMVNDQAQNVWNADTKLDKDTSTGLLRTYCVNPNGSQNTIAVASNTNTWRTDRFATLMRSTEGSESDRSKMENINVGYLLSPAPVQPFHTANKEYVDTTTIPDQRSKDPNSGLVQAVVLNAKTSNVDREYGLYTIATSTAGASSGRLVQYFSPTSGAEGTEVGNGRLLQKNPTQPYQVANKRYVDNKVKTYRHKISGSLTNTASETKVISFIVYNNNPNSLITPDTTTETTFSILAIKYLQPSTPVMFQAASEYEMDMIKSASSTAFNLVVSGDRYNFSTASGFTDNVMEC